MLDLQEKQLPLRLRFESPERYLQKVGLKTGLVFRYLAELGASLGGAKAEEVEVYGRFGFTFGLVLHLLDDLTDFLQALTRPNNSRDLCNRYISLPFIYAFQTLVSEAERGEMLNLWEQTSNKPLRESGVDVNLKLAVILRSTPAFLQTLALASQYLVEATTQMGNLNKDELNFLLRKLQNLIQGFYTRFAEIN